MIRTIQLTDAKAMYRQTTAACCRSNSCCTALPFFIRLNSGEHRTKAHAFYERCGYSCTKLQKRFIKEW